MKDGVLINFSGHQLCERALSILAERYETIVQPKPITFDFSSSIENQLEKLFEGISCPIDGANPVTVIPPGHATLAVLLVTYLHGLIGHFPAICYLELSESGVYLPKVEFSINSNQVRTAGRKYRTKTFSV